MALNYSISMLQPIMKPVKPKPIKAQISQELILKELSCLVAGQTTVSRADVSAVLIATVDNMIDSLCRRTGGFRRTGKVPSSNHQPRS